MTIRFSDEYRIVTLPYNSRMGYTERCDLRREQRAKLEAAGFKTEYRYKMSQLGLANAMAKRIETKTGVTMEVTTGFNMAF